MVPRKRTTDSDPTCWHCDARVPARRIEVESVLRTRSEGEGGPYRIWSCGCGIDCGALRNRAGKWLLYPLEGLEEADLLERLVPRHSRALRAAAEAWWRRHRGDVERFRRAPPGRAPPPRTHRRPPPRPKRESRRASPPPDPDPEPDPPPPSPPLDDVESRAPHELLGVAPDADAEAVRKAYRAALKLCHPDRVANLDPEIQDLAHRKAKALRAAYEALLNDTP